MNNKLHAKDFILIGALTALMWIICMIISIIMSVLGPVTNVFYPPAVAVPNGIVMMLLLAKVPKKGVFTICGTIQGLLFLLVGAFWFMTVALILGGILCDFLIMRGEAITIGAMKLAYSVFSAVFTLGAIGPIRFLQKAYIATMERNNIAQEYIDGLIQMTSWPMLMLIICTGFIAGYLGGLLGQKMLNKHFIKAGLVAVKN